MNSPSVFVIEDDFAVRDSLILLLRSEGLRARGFANGAEFFDNLPNDPVACIVTDLRMPGMDGFEVVRRLTALHDGAWPVIVITGHADVASAVELMKAGVTDFIEKPFEPRRLVETVKNCAGRLRQLRTEIDQRMDRDRRLSQLTPRERQVFDALVEGQSNKEIAARLAISPRTVEIFRAKVMSKMEAPNVSALVRMSLGLA
jgi:two-component system response regulator FixJ